MPLAGDQMSSPSVPPSTTCSPPILQVAADCADIGSGGSVVDHQRIEGFVPVDDALDRRDRRGPAR